jgi:hypothetical protein
MLQLLSPFPVCGLNYVFILRKVVATGNVTGDAAAVRNVCWFDDFVFTATCTLIFLIKAQIYHRLCVNLP